jgi:flavorubredoxin
MPVELFNQANHKVLLFNDLVRGEDGIQANQMLIVRGERSMLLDPGGALLYTPLSMAVARHVPVKKLTYIFASHQDPDVIGAVDRWLMYSDAKVVCSRLWGRFVPHSVPHFLDTGDDRYILLPDEGAEIPFGDSTLSAVPAHFLHSVGNFNVFDPISRVLFSGDVGASVADTAGAYAVADFDAHVPSMAGFHRRYMASNKACRIWVQQVRELPVEMIVPQHGPAFVGREMVARFLDWLEQLECGVDLMTGPGVFRHAGGGNGNVTRMPKLRFISNA